MILKNSFLHLFAMSALIISFSISTQAQIKAPPPTGTTPAPAPAPAAPAPAPTYTPASSSNYEFGANYRLLANYDYSMISPSDLNDARSTLLWNGTTRSQGTFNNLQGFSIGGGVKVEQGFLGLEFNHSTQELQNTLINPTTTSVQDTIQYEAIYAVYDFVIPRGVYSFELGGGIGYATRFQYHNLLTNNGVTEDVNWQANPVVAKVRAHFNYHFSDNIRIRGGAAYEYAASTSLTSDANHSTVIVNGSSVLSGQSLKNSSGSDVKVDISGLRLSAGLVIAF